MSAVIISRPMARDNPNARDTDLAYVMATSVDALCETHGGRFARREVIRPLVVELVTNNDVNVATFDDDPEVILGYCIKSPDGAVELLQLRRSLSRRRCSNDCAGCKGAGRHNGGVEGLPVAQDVAKALLGASTFVRMRRMPPQSWTWRALLAAGYMPSVMPVAL